MALLLAVVVTAALEPVVVGLLTAVFGINVSQIAGLGNALEFRLTAPQRDVMSGSTLPLSSF